MKRIITSILIVGFLFMLSATSMAQTSKLIYKKKGKTSHTVFATLSNQDGDTTFEPADFIKSPKVYFLLFLDPKAKRNAIKESDISNYFSSISIKQGETVITQSNPPVQKMRNEKEIGSLVIAFSKEKLLLYKEFSLTSAIDKSKPISLPDNYLPSYKKYKQVFEEGKQLLQNKQSNKAFNTLFQIWKDAQTNEEIKTYSFYSETLNMIKKSVHEKAAVYEKFFTDLKVSSEHKITRAWLNQSDSVLRVCTYDYSIFQPLFQSNIEDAKGLETYYNNVKGELNTLISTNKSKYNKQLISFLETGSYSDYQFALYVDVLTRMVSYTDSLVTITSMPTIRAESLHQFPDKEKELSNTGWLTGFLELVTAINDNIKQNQKLLNEAIFSNLKQQDSLQKQPYAQILEAFSDLPGNPMGFSTNLDEAIQKCTDANWLQTLELWNISSQFQKLNLDDRYLQEINNGLHLISEQKWAEADNTFNIIKRQANLVAMPWYYSGLIQYKQNEWFSAEAQFQHALELYPHYIAPRNFIFKILEDQKLYPELLKKANEAISVYDIWYFHFVKVKALYALKEYNKAIEEINTQCLTRNRWDVNMYYLLGDIYLAKKNYTKAKDAYNQTRIIAPFSDSKIFENKMKNLVKLQTGINNPK